MYKSLVFDFDGTIADSQNVVNDLLGDLAERHHFGRLTPRELKHRGGMSLLKKIKLLFFVRKYDPEFKALYGENIKRIQPVAGILDVLSQLHEKGIELSIISSNNSSNIERFLSINDVPFVRNIISASGISGKHKAIRRFRLKSRNPEEILYIGDEIRDIKACKKAKVDIAFVTWGLDGKEDLGAHDIKYILNKPSDLMGLIL